MSKRYGDRIIFENMDFALPSGGIVGVIGPNGAGKTTLFRLITGQETADSGQLRIGETVQLGVRGSESGVLSGGTHRLARSLGRRGRA